ncbi:MAG: GTP-binding protein [archaeon]|nr:GTP-binding protein [archaeon]
MISAEEEIFDAIVKILLVGDSGVGKTNIVTKYIKDEFNENSKATVGVEFCFKKMTIDGKKVNAQIWDTAGQEKFRSITASYYKGAKACFVVFDITKKSTFDNVDNWISNVLSQADKGVLILLIGNKTDLEQLREVPLEAAQEKAKSFNIAYMETSAKSGFNLNEAFETLIKGAMKICMENDSDNYNIVLQNLNANKAENIDTKEESSGCFC